MTIRRPLVWLVAAGAGFAWSPHARADEPVSPPSDGTPTDATPPQDPAPAADTRSADQMARDHDPIDVSIFAGERGKRITGSAHKVTKEELERYEDDNIHNTLQRVPGVYVRGEDGYGLRPNIGLRGASSDRSSKVTLMEDGILLAPAPYAAPAAYYFPLSTRLTGIEVYKGPSALRFGPNSIGGAINVLTRPIPFGHRFGADLALGSQLYAKQHVHYGYGTRTAGFVIEGTHLRTDGFKQQDGAAPLPLGNTGFDRSEFVAKGRINTDPDAPVVHELRLKLGYSRERSNETYLGLSDADFQSNPWRRYAASALDQMNNHRTLGELTYGFIVQGRFRLAASLYRHDLSRAWFKLNAIGGRSPFDVLADPTNGQNALAYAVLTGTQDSAGPDQTLKIGTNDRVLVAQGLQTTGEWQLPKSGWLEHTLQFGFRAHHDSVRRLHTEDDHLMQATATGGRLLRDDAPRATTTHNIGSAVAVAAHLVDEIAAFGAILTPGVRAELIDTQFIDRRTGGITVGTQRVLLPGVGALYTIVDGLSVLGGVHEGFSPAPPGANAGAKPEVAVNYELGARGAYRFVTGEVIGFYSDYSNLTGQCTFSSGCSESQIDTQFNAGRARITGLEASFAAEVPLARGLQAPLRVGYTHTQTRFLTAFDSDNPQWGSVEVDDELPYVPRHQVSFTGGIDWRGHAGLHVGVTALDSMRETAGQGTPARWDRTDAYAVLDGTAYWKPFPGFEIYAKGENLLDRPYIVSHRPFGARPGQPRFVYLGVKVEFDRP